MRYYISIFFLFLWSLFNAQTLVPYRDKNVWGYSDESGNVKITPKYDSVALFDSKYNKENYRFAKVLSNGKYGLIDEKGGILFNTTYKDINIDSDKYSLFIIVQNENGKFGVYDFNKSFIPEEFDKIEYIRNYSFLVKKNQKIGVYNNLGQMVIPVEYKQINYIDGDSKEVKWMVSNEKETKYIITPAAKTSDRSMQAIYEDGGIYMSGTTKTSDAAAIEKLKSKYYLSKCDNYYKEKCIYRQNNKYGFYDFELNKKTSPEYESLKILKPYRDQTYLLATKNGKNLLIDELGNSLIPVDFQEIEDRYNTLTFTKDNRKGFYFIDTQKYVEPKYQLLSWNQTLYQSGPVRNFELIPVYTDNPKDWFYIGSNGLIFKAK